MSMWWESVHVTKSGPHAFSGSGPSSIFRFLYLMLVLLVCSAPSGVPESHKAWMSSCHCLKISRLGVRFGSQVWLANPCRGRFRLIANGPVWVEGCDPQMCQPLRDRHISIQRLTVRGFTQALLIGSLRTHVVPTAVLSRSGMARFKLDSFGSAPSVNPFFLSRSVFAFCWSIQGL